MKYFNKKSYIFVFVLFFAGALGLLVSVQALVGTLRLFNASEEKFESLSADSTYTLSYSGEDVSYFSSTTNGKKEKNVLKYFSDNRDTIESALKSMSAKKAPETIKKIEIIQEKTIPVAPVVVEVENVAPVVELPEYTSPIKIEITPKNAAAPAGYTRMINTVAEGQYFRDTLWDFPVVVDTKRLSPRGQVYNETVTLSATMTSLTEASKVLVHELGHMIDIYLLRSSGTKSDPSYDYYDISWDEPTVMRSDMSGSSFISGYAASNQYEDFAETFAFYVFHNRDFQQRVIGNPALGAKYDFLQQRIFGDLFADTAYEKSTVPKTFWDVTKIVLKTDRLDDVFAGLFQIFRSI